MSWGVSLVITPLANRFSPKWVWVGSQCVFAVSMLCTLFVPPGEVAGGIAIFAFLGMRPVSHVVDVTLSLTVWQVSLGP